MEDEILNDISAGDIYKDANGDKWKVVGRILGSETRIACFDEPIDDSFELPFVTSFSVEQIAKMTLWDEDDEDDKTMKTMRTMKPTAGSDEPSSEFA